MEESPKIKIIKWVCLILAILILLGLGYYTYTIIRLDNGANTVTMPKKTETSDKSKSTSSASDSSSSASATKTTPECATTLTAAEQNQIKNWKTYTNTKYNYSFRYPTDWIMQSTGANKYEIVSLVDENTFEPTMSANFQVRAGEKVNEDDSDTFEIVEPTKSVKIDCISAKFTVYYTNGDFPGGRETRKAKTVFSKNNTKFSVIFWYPPADPSDFQENYDLILKTIDFK